MQPSSEYYPHPQWLHFLKRGTSPLLTISELDFIAKIRRLIIEETKTRSVFPSDRNLKETVYEIKDNFSQVVEFLNENRRQKDRFVQNYPTWRRARENTILKLVKIAEAARNDVEECTKDQNTSKTVSTIGGVLSLVARASPTLKFVGAAMMVVGGIAALAASAKEFEQLQERIKEAKKILMVDKKHSDELLVWLSSASCVKEALDNIKNMDIGDNLSKVATKFRNLFRKMDSNPKIEKQIKKVLDSLSCPLGLSKETADVIGILIATSMLFHRFRPLFDIMIDAHIFSNACRFASGAINTAFTLHSAYRSCSSSELSGFQKTSIGLGMAKNIIEILSSAKDKDVISKEAEKILEAANKLEKEMLEVGRIYVEMVINF